MNIAKKNLDKSEREDIRLIFGKDKNWDVFKFNLMRLICVDLLSKSFFLMIITGLCAMIVIFWTLLFSKDHLSWIVYAVIVTPPSFFGLWWIEKQRAENLIDAVCFRIKGK